MLGGGELSLPVLNPDVLYPYDTRPHPHAAPETDIFECPYYCFQVNTLWWSHIEGVLERLCYDDAWTGTDEEKTRAIYMINKLRAEATEAKMGCNDGGGGTNAGEPVLKRINSNGDMEISTDGGITWKPDPTDPRKAGAELPLLPGNEGNERCVASLYTASNMIDVLAQVGQAASVAGSILSLAQAAVELILAILFAPAAAPALIALIIQLCANIFSAGATEFLVILSASAPELLRIIYCNMPGNGILTAQSFGAIYGQIGASTTLDPLAKQAFQGEMKLWGLLGMHNAARMPTTDIPEEPDCSFLEPCYACAFDWDFLTASHDWEMISPLGTWVDGSGWNNTYPDPGDSNYHAAVLTIPTDSCIPLYFEIEWVTGSGTTGISMSYSTSRDEHGDYVWNSGYHNVSAGSDLGANQTHGLVKLDGDTVIAVRFALDTSNNTQTGFITRLQIGDTDFV